MWNKDKSVTKYYTRKNNTIDPIVRTWLRPGTSRNKACICGSTKPSFEMVNGKKIEIQVPKKAKECCLKADWPNMPKEVQPNKNGNYDPAVAAEKRKNRQVA